MASAPLLIELLSLLLPRSATWILTKREGVKSGRFGALKPDKLGLSCKANNCNDVGSGGLGILPTHETSPIKMVLQRSIARSMPSQLLRINWLRYYRQRGEARQNGNPLLFLTRVENS